MAQILVVGKHSPEGKPVRLKLKMLMSDRESFLINRHIQQWIAHDPLRRQLMSYDKGEGILTIMPMDDDFTHEVLFKDGNKEIPLERVPEKVIENIVMIGRVEGFPDLYYATRGNGGRDWWTPDLNIAHFFHDRSTAESTLDFFSRCMNLYHGTEEQIDPLTKLPRKRLDIPEHIYNLLRLSTNRLTASGNIFLCKLSFDPVDSLSVEGHHPSLNKD